MATFETNNRLRVKIVDAMNKRYEVNVLDSLQTEDVLPVHDYDYTFSVNTDVTGFSIARKSNQEVSLSSSLLRYYRLDTDLLNNNFFLFLGDFFNSWRWRVYICQSVSANIQLPSFWQYLRIGRTSRFAASQH